MNGKAKIIRQGGKGKTPNAADSISPEEEDALWSSGNLGTSSPPPYGGHSISNSVGGVKKVNIILMLMNL